MAYDGRPFDGWQSQPSGNTIQDYIQLAIVSICSEASGIQGSGRTDSGVSADAQVAHFDVPTSWRMDAVAWLKALNTKLPASIRIMECEQVDSEFHSRFSATEKVYGYRIFHGPVLPPLLSGLVWHQPRLDVAALQSAMPVFIGKHHFKAFSANRNDGKDDGRDTLREIRSIQFREHEGPLIEVEICGNGFLYKMVRFLIGSGVRMAEGKLTVETVERLLNDPDCSEKAPFCAPADGLRLKIVNYHGSVTVNSGD